MRHLISSPQIHIADTSRLQQPLLCVVIDAEEEFDWRQPFKRTGYSLRSVSAQWRAQAIFDRWQVKPIYLIDYPVLTSPLCEPVFRRFYDLGRCELGVQLHPWVTPPFDEVLSPATSYACNLPLAIHERKLDTLATEFHSQFGFDPKVHKAGRFGFNEGSAELIEEMGYDVDTSVLPFTTLENDGGPSFHGVPAVPFWFGRRRGVLELQTTCGIVGWVPSRFAERIWPKIERSAAQLHLRAISARLRLVERIKLSPEGMDLPAMERLTRRLSANGRRVFCLSYHSSSLTPGGNPYVSSEADCVAFLDRVDRYLRFFFEDIGGRATTVAELQRFLQYDQ